MTNGLSLEELMKEGTYPEEYTEGENWKDVYKRQELITDTKGYAVSPELPYGSYVVVESTTPEIGRAHV